MHLDTKVEKHFFKLDLLWKVKTKAPIKFFCLPTKKNLDFIDTGNLFFFFSSREKLFFNRKNVKDQFRLSRMFEG